MYLLSHAPSSYPRQNACLIISERLPAEYDCVEDLLWGAETHPIAWQIEGNFSWQKHQNAAFFTMQQL